MESALQALHQGNVGIGVLQETKLTKGIHTRYSIDNKIYETEVDSNKLG